MSSRKFFELSEDNKLVSSLSETDLVQFSKELCKCRVIPKKVNDTFASLDCASLDSELRIRYLLNHVSEGVKLDGALVFNRFLKVLGGLGGSAGQVSKRLHEESCVSDRGAGGEGQTCDEAGSSEGMPYDICLSEGDVSLLMDTLVQVSDKWELIGTALGLRSYTICDCKRNTIILSLTNVLREWIECSQHKEQITLSKLKLAIEGPLVGRPRVAKDMVEKFTMAKRPLEPELTPTKRACLDSTEIARQTISAEVADGKSTLLGVQLANPSNLVSYQWMKDSHPLSDASPYSGVCTDILAISPASQYTRGEYTCSISKGCQNGISEKVVLIVSFVREKERLINLYKARREIPPDSWPPAGVNTFISLALIKKNPECTTTDHYDYSVRGDVDDIIESKEKIRYEEVFGEYQSGSLVLIEGRPGSGKTTLVHKVTRDWATRGDVLMNAKMLFLIPLRCLANRMDESFSGILKLFYRKKEECEQVSNDIEKSDGEGVCCIFDGLDEYKPQDESSSVIYELLQMTYLPNAMIIVASRPVATATLRREEAVTKRVEVLGFSQDQIFEYIEKFPFSDGVCNLRAYLDLHRNVLHMCYLPVNVAIICYLYKHSQGDIPHTETEIYEHFTRFLILRKLRRSNACAQLSSLEDLSGKDEEYFQKVCHLAYDMTIHSKQIVHQRDTEVPLSSNPGPDDAPSLGLVTIDITSESYGLDGMYTFIHHTLQEYLAAFYLAKLEAGEQTEMVILYAEEGHMKMVMMFYCGMVKFDDKVDQLKEIMKSEDRLHRVQCAFESRQCVVCDHAMEVEEGVLDFSGVSLTPSDVTALSYAISNTSHLITELNMEACDLHDDHVRLFLREVSNNKLKCIQTLNLSSNGRNDMEDLSDNDPIDTQTEGQKSGNRFGDCLEGLKSCNNLQTLDLSGNNLVADEIKALAAGLKSLNNLQTLDLSGNNLVADEIKALAAGLKSLNNLQTLSLSSNEFGDNGAAALAEGLKYCNNIQTLHLNHNNIGDGGAAALAEGLKYCNNLQTLNLWFNNIHAEGTEALASALMVCNNLQTLILSHNNIGAILSDNNIGANGASALAMSLISCNNLQTLELSRSNVGDDLVDLAEGLKCCNNLQTLVLDGNSIGDIGAAALGKALKSCNNLRKLVLYNNKIGDGGTEALAEGLVCCNNLQTLVLFGNKIGTNGAEALGKVIKSCSNLQELKLSRNNIGPNGAAALAEGLKSFNNLQKLELADNNIGPYGTKALVEGLKSCDKIQRLWLLDNNIGSIGAIALVEGLKSFKNLHIFLDDNDIGADAAADLDDFRGPNQFCRYTIRK